MVIYIAARGGDIVSGGKLGFMLPVTFEKVRTNTPSNFSLAKTIWFLKGAIATILVFYSPTSQENCGKWYLFVHAVLEFSDDSAVLVQREIAVCFHDSLFERKHPVIAQWMNGLN